MPSLPQLIEEDIGVINDALQELLQKSDSTIAFLIDKGGFIITQVGRLADFDVMTLSALSAASFAATESIAGLVGESNFSSVYQQGEKNSLLVVNVDQHSLMAIIFRANLSVGAVKYFASDTVKRIAGQLENAQRRNPEGGLDLSELNMADPTPLFKMKVA
jgi:predicted regulator of Ras-like GTPase activity (Roadblock/LC7/MglB family)